MLGRFRRVKTSWAGHTQLAAASLYAAACVFSPASGSAAQADTGGDGAAKASLTTKRAISLYAGDLQISARGDFREVSGVPVLFFTASELELKFPPKQKDVEEYGHNYARAMAHNAQVIYLREKIDQIGQTRDGTGWGISDPRIVAGIRAMLLKTLKAGYIDQAAGILLREKEDYARFHFAHDSSPQSYKKPAGCLLPLPEVHYTPRQWMSVLTDLPMVELAAADLPGDAFEWMYMLVGHEINQCPGVGEAQSDKILAAEYIRDFGSAAMPLAWADMRAVNAVMKAHDGTYSSRYGWAPVAAIDAVINRFSSWGRPGTGLENLNDEAFNHIDPRAQDLQTFATALKNRNHRALKDRDLHALLQAARGIIQDEEVTYGNIHIANRFIQALERLSGEQGYEMRPALMPQHPSQQARALRNSMDN